MTEYSYTRLTTWEECHYSYYLKYIDDNKPEKADNAFAQYGHLCHTLIDEWAQGLIDDSVLWFEYEERYPDFVTAPYPAFMKKVQEKAYDDGLKYFESFNGFPGYEIIATEKAYHTTLNGYKFTGIIDMIMKDKETGELIILDHKSKTLDTYKKEEKTIYNQLHLYSKFIYDEYGKWPDKLAFNLFREGGLILSKPFDKEEYDRVFKWAVDIIEDIESNDVINMIQMKEKPEFYCNELCDVRKGCTFGSARPPRKKDK